VKEPQRAPSPLDSRSHQRERCCWRDPVPVSTTATRVNGSGLTQSTRLLGGTSPARSEPDLSTGSNPFLPAGWSSPTARGRAGLAARSDRGTLPSGWSNIAPRGCRGGLVRTASSRPWRSAAAAIPQTDRVSRAVWFSGQKNKGLGSGYTTPGTAGHTYESFLVLFAQALLKMIAHFIFKYLNKRS